MRRNRRFRRAAELSARSGRWRRRRARARDEAGWLSARQRDVARGHRRALRVDDRRPRPPRRAGAIARRHPHAGAPSEARLRPPPDEALPVDRRRGAALAVRRNRRRRRSRRHAARRGRRRLARGVRRSARRRPRDARMRGPHHRRGASRVSKTLVIYLMAEPETPDLARAAVDGGADVIELGFPYSDPLADGPVIRRAGERALARGMRTNECLEVLARTRELGGPDTPPIPMTYSSLFEAHGWDVLTREIHEHGGTSMIVAD